MLALFATSVRPGATAPYKNQLGYHGTHSGGGNPSSRQQTAPDRFAAGRQRQAVHDEVTTTRSAFPFVRGQRPPVQRAPRSKASRLLAVAASMNHLHVRHQSPAARPSIATIPPTQRR